MRWYAYFEYYKKISPADTGRILPLIVKEFLRA